MLHKFFNAIRHINEPSGFEQYLNNIHRVARAGEPTLEEARRDYRAFTSHESGFYG